MENLLSKDPEKVKEKILSFLLVFLILLVPISILTSRNRPEVEITGLSADALNDSAERLNFNLKSNSENDLKCKISVGFYKNGVLVDKYIQDIGAVPAHGIKQGSLILNLPNGKNSWVLNPECFPKTE